MNRINGYQTREKVDKPVGNDDEVRGTLFCLTTAKLRKAEETARFVNNINRIVQRHGRSNTKARDHLGPSGPGRSLTPT